ncbi:MAG: PEGA domain-containing protein [Lachnospiraceae bacterium]|nr:PEGA domain-containing protein [Lachnospiraceae bacterium]
MMKKSVAGTILILLGLTLFMACGNQSKEAVGSGLYSANPIQGKSEAKASLNNLYMIQNMNMAEEIITLYDLSNNETLQYRYGLMTQFLDARGKTSSWSNFTSGRVVKIGNDQTKTILSKVQLSDKVWEQTGIKNYKVNTEDEMLTIGQTKYHLLDSTKVFSGENLSDPTLIGANDILTVVGQEKNILSVNITTGHGTIELMNTSKFDNSMIEIGTKVITNISGEGMKIEVAEGNYRLTVANNSYGGSMDVTVNRDQTTVVDLSQLEGEGPKKCTITFTSTVENAKIYLDNQEVSVGESITVNYGRHSLKVVADGYDTWNKTLIVNSESAEILLDPTTSTNSDNSATTGGDSSGESSNSSNSSSDSNSSSKSSDGSNSNANSGGSSSSGSASSNSSSKDASKAAADYLTTLSNTVTNLLGNSSK